MKIAELISQVVNEANSDAGTWSLSAMRMLQQAKEKFNEEELKPFFDNVSSNVSVQCKPVTIYKWAQFLSHMHFTNFPGFEKFYQTKGRKIKSIVESFQSHPLGKAAIALIQKIPLNEPQKHTTFLPIAQSKSQRFLIQKNDVQTIKKDKITCCSPPPFKAL